jgi:hypothetical protein
MLRIGSREVERLIRLVELGILHGFMFHQEPPEAPYGVLAAIGFNQMRLKLTDPITNIYVLREVYADPPLLDVNYHLITRDDEEVCKAYIAKRWAEIGGIKINRRFIFGGRERLAIVIAVPPNLNLDDIEKNAVALGTY